MCAGGGQVENRCPGRWKQNGQVAFQGFPHPVTPNTQRQPHRPLSRGHLAGSPQREPAPPCPGTAAPCMEAGLAGASSGADTGRQAGRQPRGSQALHHGGAPADRSWARGPGSLLACPGSVFNSWSTGAARGGCRGSPVLTQRKAPSGDTLPIDDAAGPTRASGSQTLAPPGPRQLPAKAWLLPLCPRAASPHLWELRTGRWGTGGGHATNPKHSPQISAPKFPGGLLLKIEGEYLPVVFLLIKLPPTHRRCWEILRGENPIAHHPSTQTSHGSLCKADADCFWVCDCNAHFHPRPWG